MNLLRAFMNRVLRLCEMMVQPVEQIRAVDVHGAMQVVSSAHDECESALDSWVERWAHAFSETRRNDPSGGAFDALTVALEDGYHAACLANLTLLGMSFHATRVDADGLTKQVEQAYGLTVQWYDEATAFAKSITDDVKPRSLGLNRKMYSIYRDRVPEEARAAYRDLQPYLDEMTRVPAL